jgi:hypothetical protein
MADMLLPINPTEMGDINQHKIGPMDSSFSEKNQIKQE